VERDCRVFRIRPFQLAGLTPTTTIQPIKIGKYISHSNLFPILPKKMKPLLSILFLTITLQLQAQSRESSSLTINFNSSQHQLSSTAQNKLSKALQSINPNNIIRIALIGHTDNDGEITYNQKLSERRSQATLSFLLKAGVSKDRIETYSKGEVEPKADNATKAGQAINRRVEITIIYESMPQ